MSIASRRAKRTTADVASIDMLLRSRKHRFRGWSEKDVRTSRQIRRGMPLLPLGLGKTTRSTTVFSGHANSQVSSEQLALAGCYSNINDGANTYRLQLPSLRRCAVEASFASDAHTMPSSPRTAYWHQEATVQSHISAARAPRISHANTSCRTLPYSARWHDFLGTRKALPLSSRRSRFFSGAAAPLKSTPSQT